MSTQVFELERGLPIPTCYATSQCKEDSALKVNKKKENRKKEQNKKAKARQGVLRILTHGLPVRCGTEYSTPSSKLVRVWMSCGCTCHLWSTGARQEVGLALVALYFVLQKKVQ